MAAAANPPALEKMGDVLLNLADFMASRQTLRAARGNLALQTDAGCANVQALRAVSLAVQGTAADLTKSAADALQGISIDMALLEDLARYAIAVERQVLGDQSQDVDLATHRMMHTLSERIQSTAEAIKGASRMRWDTQSTSEMAALLEDMEALLLATDHRIADLTCWLDSQPSPDSFQISSALGQYPVDIERKQSKWKSAARALRRRHRPVLSLNLFEQDEDDGRNQLDYPPLIQIAPESAPSVEAEVSQSPCAAPSAFAAAQRAIEAYDVIKVIKAPPTPPPPKPSPAPAPAPVASPPAPAAVDWHARISEIVAQRKPEKLPEVAKWLVKYAGREEELLRTVMKQFASPSEGQGRARSGSQAQLGEPDEVPPVRTIGRKNSMDEHDDTAPRERSNSKQLAVEASPPRAKGLARVEEIYRLHNPAKLAEIPSLMAKYANREDELIEKLEKKYHAARPSAVMPVPIAAAPASSPALGAGWGTAGLSAQMSSPFQSSPAPATSLFHAPAAPTPAAGLFQPQPATATQGFGLSPGFALPAAAQYQPDMSQQQMNGIIERVQEIYRQHNPAKLSEIPHLLDKYRGKELQLIANLEKKYNCAGIGSPAMSVMPSQPAAAAGGLFGSPAPRPAASLFAPSSAGPRTPFGTPGQGASPFGTSPAPTGSLFNRPQQQPQQQQGWGTPSPMQPTVPGSGFGNWGR